MNLNCQICNRYIPRGTWYGQFVFTIERFETENRVEVKEAKAITTLCIKCAKEYNSFKTARRLID